MVSDVELTILAVLAIAIVLLVVWALLGPRRGTDERGYHVDLAEETRKRDLERERNRAPEDDET